MEQNQIWYFFLIVLKKKWWNVCWAVIRFSLNSWRFNFRSWLETPVWYILHILLQGRIDDNIDTIKNRLKVFESLNLPVIDYYAKKGKLYRVTLFSFIKSFLGLTWMKIGLGIHLYACYTLYIDVMVYAMEIIWKKKQLSGQSILCLFLA